MALKSQLKTADSFLLALQLLETLTVFITTAKEIQANQAYRIFSGFNCRGRAEALTGKPPVVYLA